jgi:cytochrome c oxidase subunit 2
MGGAQVLQSALAPAGPQAARIFHLWWLMCWVTAIVFVLVLIFLGWAVVRGRRDSDAGGVRLQPDRRSDAALTRAVAVAVGLTIVTLFVLLVASVWTGRAVASLGASSAVSIEVTGYQWWWGVEYEDQTPSRRVRTANEIHVPIGRPVVLKVTSHDVIHSFWVPNLHGKRDLVPGYTTAIWLQADSPGVYRGQCAEFCGLQHAHMAFTVTAETDEQFQRWLQNQGTPAPEPGDPSTERGRYVFLHSTCPQCHTIRGTIAAAVLGPDLTHVGSRGTLAAGTLPNTLGHLAQWVADPQEIKPGNRMPPTRLAPDDLGSVVAYLESLK